MEKEKLHYKKIIFWGTILGNSMLLCIVLCILFFPTIRFSFSDSASDNPLVEFVLFPLSIITFCFPAFKLRRTAKIASNLLYKEGVSTREQLVQEIPLVLKWLSREKEIETLDQMIANYSKYVMYFAFMSPFLFVVWMKLLWYPMSLLYK